MPDVVEAIRVVAAGEVYVRPAVARLLASTVVPKGTAVSPRDRFQLLSDRKARASACGATSAHARVGTLPLAMTIDGAVLRALEATERPYGTSGGEEASPAAGRRGHDRMLRDARR